MSVEVNEDSLSVNCLLTLYLIDRANGEVNDRIRLEKASFLSQKNMADNEINAFVYEFFRYRNGPFSTNVIDTEKTLIENGLMTSRGFTDFKLTDSGKKLLNDFKYIINENPRVVECIDEALKAIIGKSLTELLDFIYSMKVKPIYEDEERTIRELPEYTTIIRCDNFSSVVIDEDDLATIQIYRDINQQAIFERGFNEAREGKLYRWGEPIH